MRDFKLYVILDEGTAGLKGGILEIAQRVILAGADIIQLRAKGSSDQKILKIGWDIQRIINKNKRKTLFLLNDRADLARIIDADGVHLGQEDLSVKEARRILGKNKIVGVSTHSVQQAAQAQKQGADYISIGPIFPTPIKPDISALTPQIIARVKERVKIPFVAVGGIRLDNLRLIQQAGAKRVAVCRAIISAQDAFLATKEFRQGLYK